MREYRNRICSAVLAAVCVIGTALIPSRAVHAEDVVDPVNIGFFPGKFILANAYPHIE